MTRVGITGHRGLDHGTTTLVDAAIRQALRRYAGSPLVGVTCLADGADSLFGQAVLDRGGRLEVIVPAAEYRDALPAEHHDSYDRLLAQAGAVHRLDFVASTAEAHLAASLRMLAMVTELLAVWDGQPARGYGGTADVVAAARARSVPVHVLWPAGAVRT
ncbi:MAG: hypothetical protein HY241_17540 [Actinobacteria bacterium]|nr:hypothetical protein [Actinomycetota bacterium]